MQIPGNLAVCPGYVDAVIRENEIRDAAMLNLNTRICGIEIQQITLRHWIILDGIHSPFIGGGTPSPVDVVKFLWVMSPKFDKRKNSFKKWRFIRSCSGIHYGEAVVSIRKLIDETFQDSPPGGDEKWEAPQVSFAASVIYAMAGKFHWSRETILNLPLKETFQHLKQIRMSAAASRGETNSESNPSDLILIRERRRVREERLLERHRKTLLDMISARLAHN